MGTIFKYNNQLVQCQNLQKKLRKMKIKETDIEIVKDDVPNDLLEKEFVALTRIEKGESDEIEWIYYVFKNSKGYYLYSIVSPTLEWFQRQFGYDVSDYKLIGTFKNNLPAEYRAWNPETKTGIK